MRKQFAAGWAALALIATIAWSLPACSDCNLSVSTTELPAAAVDVVYAAVLDSHCGGDVWFLQNGDLPPGIGLQDNGDLNGTPTNAGRYTFTVGVFDFGSGETAYKGLSILVEGDS